MNRQGQQFGVRWLIVLAGAGASILMFWVTDYGLGVSADSTRYVETARNLAAGNGFSAGGITLTHYPPTYPILLAVAGIFHGGDILQAGRLLGALLFGANLVQIGLAVQMGSERSLSATACAMLFFLCSGQVILIHSMAWSEAPFVTFCLAAIVLLSRHVVRPTPYLHLTAALMAAFAITTRYAGVTLLPTMAIALLLFGDRPMSHKIRDTILVTAIASLPLAFWLIRNIAIAGTATNRTFAIHPIDFEHVTSFVNAMYDYALPIPVPDWTKVLLLSVATALLVGALVYMRRKNYIKRNTTSVSMVIPVISILFFMIYVAFLVISISFFDAHTPFDTRTMLPAVLPLAVAGIALARSLSRALNQRLIWYGFVFFALTSIGLNGYRATLEAIDIHENGRGYTSRPWHNSEILAYLTDAQDNREIYSNGPDIIRFLTGKDAVMIPNKVFPATSKRNEDYEEQFARMSADSREGKVLVVYLDEVTWRWYLPSLKELESRDDLPMLRRFKDGTIYAR